MPYVSYRMSCTDCGENPVACGGCCNCVGCPTDGVHVVDVWKPREDAEMARSRRNGYGFDALGVYELDPVSDTLGRL